MRFATVLQHWSYIPLVIQNIHWMLIFLAFIAKTLSVSTKSCNVATTYLLIWLTIILLKWEE